MFFYYYDEEKGTTVPMELDDSKLNTGDFEFFNDGIRKVWNSQEEEWYFSIIDVIAVLTKSTNATAYWRKLKQRLKEEGNETVTNCHGLKMKASVMI